MTVADLPQPTVVRTSLSPSRAGDFLTCPLLYRFRVVDRLPEPVDPVATRGTLVHAVLDELFSLPALERTVERAAALLPEAWQQLRTEDERLAELFGPEQSVEFEQWLDSAVGLLESYFSLEDPTCLEPAARELRVEHASEIAGVTLAGIVDRLDISPDGLIRIVDYKTGRSPDPRFESRAIEQLKFYALVVWRTRHVLPTVLQLYYLSDRSVLSYSPTEAELIATERRLGAVWAAITGAYERREFTPSPGPLCRFCAHQDACPQFGGTPPPMPQVVFETPASGVSA